jgi:putative transposase
MARQARGEIPTGTYHVTTRSAGPVDMFVNDFDRASFCSRLTRVIAKFGWTCRAFCLMTTHYHLILDVEANRLQPGMQSLNGPYAQGFNKMHGRTGHLHGDRYHAEPILSDGHMLGAFRYVARNPVRAGLCRNPTEWMWSSYRGHAGLDYAFAFVDHEPMRAYFGHDREVATRALRNFVEGS